jgi:hypothetical protein
MSIVLIAELVLAFNTGSFSLNEEQNGERQLQSSFLDVESSTENGCQICPLLDSGMKIAFSANRTGKALRGVQEAALIIPVKRGQSVILNFWFDDWSLLELEYYTIANESCISVLEVIANQERNRASQLASIWSCKASRPRP